MTESQRKNVDDEERQKEYEKNLDFHKSQIDMLKERDGGSELFSES